MGSNTTKDLFELSRCRPLRGLDCSLPRSPRAYALGFTLLPAFAGSRQRDSVVNVLAVGEGFEPSLLRSERSVLPGYTIPQDIED